MRRFWPGSEWLLIKLYGGWRTLDDLLASDLGNLISTLRDNCQIDMWNFVRLSDPDWHLAVRFHSATPEGTQELLRRASELTNLVMRSNTIWKADWCSFVPEHVRFGGEDGWDLAQKVFDCDSNLAMDTCAGEQSEWRRYLIVMASINQLFGAYQPSSERKLILATDYRDRLERHRASQRREHAAVFRERRKDIARAIETGLDAVVLEALAQRGQQMGELVARLDGLASRIPHSDFLIRCAHMLVNRCVARGHATVEYAIADWLCLHYKTTLAMRTISSPVSEAAAKRHASPLVR